MRLAALLLSLASALLGCEHAGAIAVSRCEWQTGAGCSSLPAVCHADGPLPDSACTPGSLNPDVTPENINQTICSRGWTRTVRPPVSYTNALKRDLLTAYGLDSDLRLFELDHLIPLELGGALSDSSNLWPESHEPRPGSYEKDGFENFLNSRVCAGELSLSDAQDAMAHDWLANWRAAGSPPDPFRQ